MTNKISQYSKKAFDIATKDMREDFNRKVLEATYKAQKQYGFEMGTGKKQHIIMHLMHLNMRTYLGI